VSDFLLQLGGNKGARKLVKTLGLPIPLPQPLRRASGPWVERPLADRQVVVGAAVPVAAPADAAPAVLPVVARALVAAGAEPHLAGPLPAGAGDLFRELGDAYGRPARALELAAVPERLRADALVFDATAVATPEGLRALYDFFHPLLPALAPSGRVLVLGRPPAGAATALAAAARAGLEGFVRSLAKEIGKRGATAQLVLVEPGAERRAEPLLRFLLSPRSAFVTGQVLVVDTRVAGQPSGDEPPATRPLEGKRALVTGAARGIGEATARRLAEEGAHVVCLDRPADDGPTSQLARAIGGAVLPVDVADPAAPAAIAAYLRQHGGVDLVVHNAGITRDKTLARMQPDQWDTVLDINLAAVARIDEALGELLHDGGRAVYLSSVAGLAGNVGQTSYAASKAGIAGYVRARAAALAARGIAVNGVAPGFIETRLTAAIPVFIREAGRRLSALGQGGLPRDVAEVITFLVSPGASGLCGAVLRVCGGALIGA
jgi:3-oxoacyl-[acyl-carrier protein] reductase